MITKKFQALATAFLLGTAIVGGSALMLAAPAAAAVRPAVGTPLKEAQSLAAAGNYKAAMAKVNEAEAVSGKTAEESSIISQMKQYIGVKSGDASIGGAAGAKAKFANDYAAKKYADVIADAEMLKKNNILNQANQLVIAQAYYLSGNKAGCVKYIKSTFGAGAPDAGLELQMRCAYDAQDEASQREALETLVGRTQKPEYWSALLKLSEHGSGNSDHDTLDIYRLKMLTGTIAGKDEYTLLAQLALQLGFPAEAEAVVEKGQAAKVLNDDRTIRLLNLAKTQAGADMANMGKNLAAANAAPTGDALVKIGEDQWGMGKYPDAIATLESAMKKKLANKNQAEIRLGMAYMSAGRKADAQKAFDAVKPVSAADKSPMVAHLYSLYARGNGAAAAGEAKPAKAAKSRK